MPETSTTIDIHYEDVKTAQSIMDAISPDNLDAPEGIDINVKVDGNILKISISCSRDIGSLISTVDDLLSCVQVAERAIDEIEKVQNKAFNPIRF
jgi:tRNA threonylcarbamoyladenosine modification (KEOPS) complex  Pcc1 subunit